MADYDRVRYAQGGEAPLSFDRRAPSRGGGPAPVTLILSVLLLVGVGGGVFYMYRSGLRGPGDAPRPVGAPIGEVRTAAPPQAQTPDPGAGLTIYKDDPNAATAAPAFVPPPEQPAPRPTSAAAPVPDAALVTAKALPPASPAPVAGIPLAPTAKPAGRAAAASASPSTSAGVAAKATPGGPLGAALQPHAKVKAAKTASIDTILADAGTGPGSAPLVKPHAAAKTPRTDPAKAAADESPPANPKAGADAKGASKTAVAGGKPPVVQIGAYSSKDLAEAGWNAAAGAAPGGMAGKAKHVVPLAKADGSTLYRTSITGFASRDQALALCAKLKAAGQSCFVR